jgi:hypothetical protein
MIRIDENTKWLPVTSAFGLLLPYYLVVAGVLMDKKNGWFGIAALGISFSLSGTRVK